MSNTPTPPEASGELHSTPEPLVPEAKRPWTILGRLTRAMREQNWFAVVLELAIVVLGVVIGFQVTRWGQDRADQAQEQIYLRQLVEDLRETERIVADRDARMDAETHRAYSHLMNSFGQRVRPPRDSVVAWLSGIYYTAAPRPVLGTAEAFVASGDFGAVADDSLRAAILRYLDLARETMTDQENTLNRRYALSRAINLTYDRGALFEEGQWLAVFFARNLDSTALAAAPDWEHPFPYDPLAIYDDPAVFRTLVEFGTVLANLKDQRIVYSESAAALREQIGAYLDS